MKVGLIGFARSGKTTVFNSITGAHAEVGAYGNRDANVAVIKVPDERVDRLSEIFQLKKKVYAEIEFIDIAPAEGMDEDRVLDGAALTVLKSADALTHVVRAFKNDNVMHPRGKVDPVRDVLAMEEELQLIDLIQIEKRIERLEKEHRKDQEYDLLLRCREHLEAGKPLRSLDLSSREELLLRSFSLLSQKPVMLLCNCGDDGLGEEDPAGLSETAAKLGLDFITLCGSLEMEVNGLPEEERAAFREELGMGEGSRTRFIQFAYTMLGLISFLTSGERETHAWTIRKGDRAVDAAGVIHSDIKRGFIRAETVAYDDFIEAGSMAKAKEKGKVRLEGKEYVVQDGDMILFRFNV
ncbi:MAG: redox-regulated ATPase YchF [Candidatus Hydrogenedens sp.]|jgi:GTP-binding protein YchF|nr:redox-regulated ATPase YchF [Candidatus Hydrogenedens sp.]